MKIDNKIYDEIKSIAESELLNSSKNDTELLTYLQKQDSITLNRLKTYFSEPRLSLTHSIKITVCGTLFTLFMFFATNEFSHLTGMIFRLFIGIIGFLWLISVYKNSRKIQISKNFKEKSENFRIIGMIDFVLEQRYRGIVS
ncbi:MULTISPECIES: hypothetical protein [Bacillus amyloliquefaciens group]|uniref:hypothetical protein n=1 Tax=Bacillus amyloliquefaciens group TaxID=1938374 RepID=UPI00077D81A8|nr:MULTISPECIES: hypothetical protein [Bacillus amyloliquefaciens group]AMQ72730.1 hypothetical protein BAMY6614_05120 [Bacillus amyloliquefaciens UMAF6614]AWM46579.1 hypothetical protein DDT09_01295 [Bacillus amyloliquefaciens]MBF6667991.1 hypothetical protein [Bacillus velezensis]